MAKIKVCLDSACINYRLVEDGKLIEQRKAKCDRNWVPPDGFDEKFEDMFRQVNEISLASPNMFDLTSKEGEELRLVDKTPRTKKERIATLKKELKELETGIEKD